MEREPTPSLGSLVLEDGIVFSDEGFTNWRC